MAHSIEVPSEIIRKWQEFVNLLAEIMHVPSASIMRADPPHIKVFVSSTSKGNPCEPGALDRGPYCETVMKTGQPLLVPDALENEAWKANPHVRAGIISYLGVPISWPDGRLFGTLAHSGTTGSRFCIRTNRKKDATTGQTVCARARALSIITESATLKETTAGSSLAPNRSGQVMGP